MSIPILVLIGFILKILYSMFTPKKSTEEHGLAIVGWAIVLGVFGVIVTAAAVQNGTNNQTGDDTQLYLGAGMLGAALLLMIAGLIWSVQDAPVKRSSTTPAYTGSGNCPVCGRIVLEDDQECWHCHTPLETAPDAWHPGQPTGYTWTCACGEININSFRRCRQCERPRPVEGGRA